jgi:hypothetical protein
MQGNGEQACFDVIEHAFVASRRFERRAPGG